MTTKSPAYKKAKVKDLIPYANNARTHSDEQVAQIASSIKEFGFINPVIVDADGGIIAGHGRVMAAKKLGIDEVPTLLVEHLSEAQKKAYILADNKMALNAGWDDALLAIELQDLQSLDFDLSLTGFELGEINGLLDEEEIEPELIEQNYNEVFNVIVECEDEQQQERIFNKLDGDGYKCRVQSL